MFRYKRFTFLPSLRQDILKKNFFYIIPRTRARKFSGAHFPHPRCGKWAARYKRDSSPDYEDNWKQQRNIDKRNSYKTNNSLPYTAGAESLDDYFQKGALLAQKAALNLWYVDTRPNSQKLFPSIWRSVILGLQHLKNTLISSYIFHSHNSNRPFR